MSLENQTIGFIENSFRDVLKIKRQKSFGAYRVDLYFCDYKLIIECDEKNHSDRNEDYEKKREEYLILQLLKKMWFLKTIIIWIIQN